MRTARCLSLLCSCQGSEHTYILHTSVPALARLTSCGIPFCILLPSTEVCKGPLPNTCGKIPADVAEALQMQREPR